MLGGSHLFGLFVIASVILGCRRDEYDFRCKVCYDQIDSASTNYFLEDAQAFAYLEIAADSTHTGYNEVVIDPETEYCYLAKLSAIYQASVSPSSPTHDLIFTYKVHQGIRTMLNGFTIGFSDSLGLREEFLSSPGYTSNAFLNQLSNEWGFTKTSSIPWNYNVIVYGDENLNVRYIREQLELSPEIDQVWLDYFFLDGPAIEYTAFPDYDEFIFQYGWGDCPSGCFYHHYWRIHLDSDCQVELVEEYGHDLPE